MVSSAKENTGDKNIKAGHKTQKIRRVIDNVIENA